MLRWDGYNGFLLALCIWREARGQGYNGMFAVACSIRNRVLRPAWWGRSYAECITKKWQYSSVAAPGDPQLIRFPARQTEEGFDIALLAANDAISGKPSPVDGADSYYDDSIPPPNWATPSTFVKKLGRLNFHDLDHDYESHQ